MTELLAVKARVPCACPRRLVAAPIVEHIRRRPDGRIYFPAAAHHVGLQIWHREGCTAARPVLQVAS